jgi:hypothetical protein
VGAAHARVDPVDAASGSTPSRSSRLFNGPSGKRDAYKSGLLNKIDCCYASGKGQQLIAELLLKTGVKPSN